MKDLQKRFTVVRHRKGTRTLVDNQTKMSFWCEDDDEVIKNINALIDGLKTNESKFIENKDF